MYYGNLKILRVFTSVRLFCCVSVNKIVSKIQTKPARLGPIIVLNTHTGHEDYTHSFLKFRVQISMPLWLLLLREIGRIQTEPSMFGP